MRRRKYQVVSVTDVLKQVTAGEPHPFRRRLILVNGRSLIESVCIHCDFRTVGSVSDGLPQKELEHFQEHKGAGHHG